MATAVEQVQRGALAGTTRAARRANVCVELSSVSVGAVGVRDAARHRLARRQVREADEADAVVLADPVVVRRIAGTSARAGPASSGSTRGCARSCAR